MTTDCYSASDRPLMLISQRLRAQALAPLLALMTRTRLRADYLTLLSLVVGLAAALTYPVSPLWALILLGAHVALDGLDGPLARFQGRASPKGSFADSLADQLVVCAFTIVLIHEGTVSVLPGTLYLLTYTLVVAFAMVRNALQVPYTWLVRPRFFVYGWVVIELYWLSGTMNYVLWFMTGLLLLKVLTGYVKIRSKL